jgi:hypothetical protein
VYVFENGPPTIPETVRLTTEPRLSYAIAVPTADIAGLHWLALVPLAAGVTLLIWCARAFLLSGEGTLAPWDPPRHLVTTGPYAVSRNPMYVAVFLILIGWAIAFASWPLLGYALDRLDDRPELARRFGSALGDCRPATDILSPAFLMQVLRP